MLRKVLNLLVVLALALGLPSAALAQDSQPPLNPDIDVSGLLISDGDLLETPVDAALLSASGPVQVVVGLVDAPLAKAVGANAKQKGSSLSARQQRAYLAALAEKQDALLGQIEGLGGQALGRVSKALNAVIVEVDAARVAEIAALPNVRSIRPLGNYEMDLSETVPYIGAAAVQSMGYDGTGVRVAVLDSGVDYTHYNLGGAGTLEAYAAAYGVSNADPLNTTRDGLFPTEKVYDGYDFVGETWPNGPLAIDDDPIDYEGHGTHVADIIAGKSLDGMHKGVAPGAQILAVKVCSAVSTSCSGVALLQGMDYALDPNMDGDISDAVDVINMSLGSSYGQREDDLSAASANAVAMGVVVVVSAGNSADKPFIVGSPSSTPEVISVAQTQVPSAKLFVISAGSVSVGGSWQAWSAAPALVSAPLIYGNGAGGNLLACSSYPAGSLAGKILLVDRGTCAISIKVSNGAAASALAVIVANNAAQAPGDLPPDFSFGGGNPSVPGYSITRADGLLLKTVLGQTATIDPASAASLVGNMVASSSRGPSYSFSTIKPDIGAPGASLSAEVGTGTGETAFGGTSGAAPMVSGAAALVIQKFPAMAPAEVKARLMNTGNTNIGINPVGLPGYLAPITRIGGGEVRVDNAFAATTSAWDADALTGSLSFGYQALTGSATYQKTVVVRNYSNTARTYSITPSFRYADDAASGAVTVNAPASIRVPANSARSFKVQLKVDATRLPVWGLNGGLFGGDGYRLQSVEFDGYIHIADPNDTIHVAWHILPHKAAEVTPASESVTLSGGAGSLLLSNPTGSGLSGRVDVFSLLGTSGRIPPPNLPEDGENYAVVDLKNFGVREAGSAIQFAISTFGTRAHPNYPAEFDIYIDNNRDGAFDAVIYNLENGGFGATGQNVVAAVNLNTGAGGIYFFADADLKSGNIILTAPLSVLGLTPGQQFDVSVYAFDNYFTGNLTDYIEGMTYTLGTPRYVGSGIPSAGVPAGGSATLSIQAVPGGETASPSQQGLLLMYRDAREQREADAIFVTP